jgi:quinol monooxygenase YgiN
MKNYIAILLLAAIALAPIPANAQSTLNLVLTYKVKEGMQEKYESAMKSLIAASQNDPGTLVFNLYKDSSGTYCLLERYASEAAFAKHKQLAASALTDWFAVTEIQKFIALGNLSEELSNKFKAAGYEVYATLNRIER